MAYCTNCGAALNNGVKFCPSCGAKVFGDKDQISVKESSVAKKQILPEEPEKREQKTTKEGKKIIGSVPRPQQTNNPVKNKKQKKKGGCLRFFLKTVLVLFILMVIGVVIIYFLPDNRDVSRLVKKLPNIEKRQDINVDVGVEGRNIGNSEKNNFQIEIPKNTFEKSVKLEVKEAVGLQKFDFDGASPLGLPFDFVIDQRLKRLNEPVTVRLNLFKPEDPKVFEHPDDVRIGYYDGKQWNYFKPDKVNLDAQYVSFKTYHFSWFFASIPTKEERMNEFAKDNAVIEWTKKTNSKPIRKAVQQVLVNKLGIKDKSMLQDIVESMMNEDDFQKLVVSYNDNNKTQFNQDLAILAGKKIVEVVKDYDVAGKTLLKGVTNHASKIGAAVNIGVALSEGDLKKAAEELSLEIINSYPITKLFSEGAKVIGNEIVRWKNQGVENAYEVYVKGIDKYGYASVEKGNFEQVWNQMKGVSRQLIIDEKKRYAKQKGKKWDNLSDKERKNIELKVKQSLKQQFIKRRNKEADIRKIEKDNLKLIKEFESAHLLSRGSFGYTDYTSFDQMLSRLFRLKNMILSDTRSKLGFSGISSNGIISAKRVAMLIQIWYGKNGKEEYQKKLVELGYKKKEDIKSVENISVNDISGSYEGYFQITENKFFDSMTKSAAYVFDAVGLGDDAKENLKAAESVFEEPEGLRRKRYLKMVFTKAGGNHKYKVNATLEGDGMRQTYKGKAKVKDGKITFELKDASGSFNFEGKLVSKQRMKGTFYIGSKMFKAAEGIWKIKRK